jgi:acyl transferase domain-containing protein/surfactin synthase thioesterase subunit/acyl carrier protein
MAGSRANTDVAIIGLAGRFPGADSAEEYWRNLCDGVESITFFSDRELLDAGVDPALIANPNYVKAAPTLRDVEMFDAAFFGFAPKDAALMDPQQRILLEVAWEAFENAGYDPGSYPGRVGVLSTGGGVVTSYLLAKLHHKELPGQTASLSHINNDKDFLSTRVSFKLNLTGPSFTIQSACSSSLVATHFACQNLRFNECDMMLVGGSVVRVPQTEGYLAEKRNLHSLDGHCRPFDEEGQGTIFGSAVGAVLLKPLDRAVADRDHIYAVIKGTAVNNDGSAKSSYTAPSLGPQSQAVVDALAVAGVEADSIGYVECHSTGTIVGDPLEIDALTRAFRNQTERRQYCAVGSVKANIGHPEQAAGIAGLIKAALVLHHKTIPPSINYERPNPEIDFDSSPFFVNKPLRDFPAADTPRRVGLNSLGIGGTNAFAVLEEAPPRGAREDRPADPFRGLVTLSAKSADALVARVEQLLTWLDGNPEVSVADLCYTTNLSRSQFAFRFAAAAGSVSDLKRKLASWLEATRSDTATLKRTADAPVAFLFPGQGAQHPGMAADLYRSQPVFRDIIDRCNALAEPYLEHGLLDVIFAEGGDDALVNRTDYTQPALFAVEYALAELAKSWGIKPSAVIGHSLGEFTAACVANAMSLEDAMRLLCARGALMHRLPGGGAMASIFAGEAEVRALIDDTAREITVAAMNGPLNTVVSGGRDALKMLFEELDRRDIAYRELRISNGFHSPLTEPILDDLEQAAADIEHNAPEIPLISNLTGEVMSQAPDAVYWRRHLREGVRFGDGMLALGTFGCRTFLEVGPHPVLTPMAQMCLGEDGKSAAWVPMLNRQNPDAESLTEMLAALYLAGHEIDWTAVHARSTARRIALPTYPFQRKRHWIEDNAPRAVRTGQAVEAPHPLLGARLDSSAKDVRYETRYGARSTGYLSDHKVAGTVVLPTTAELEAATVAGRIHLGTSQISFEDAMHHSAMPFANGEDRTVQVRITPLGSDAAGFALVSTAGESSDDWRTHMTGTLRRSEPPSRPAFSVAQVRARCRQTLPVADLYDWLGTLGLEYGPSFRGIQELHFAEREALTKVRLPAGLETAQYLMHPAFLDACLHVYPVILDDRGAVESNGHDYAYLPIYVQGFRCYRDGVDEAWAHTRLRGVQKDGTRVIDIRVYDAEERPVAELEGLSVRLLPLAKVQSTQDGAGDMLYRASWRKSVRAVAENAGSRAPASWIVFADRKRGVGAALAGALEAAGDRCHLVHREAAFARTGPQAWTVNERDPQTFRRLLEEIAAGETLPCAGVVYLWGLDAPPMDGLTLAELQDGSETMCRGALTLLHAVVETRSPATADRRLWFVTRNTQKARGLDRPIDPLQAPLWGLGRTAALEHPGVWGGLIDLQLERDGTPDMGSLAAELRNPDGESQIAIADGERYVARFVKQSLSELPARQIPVRGDATYLVTGGLGMLGRNVAKWLICKGAKHLVLTGRNATSDAVRAVFSEAEIGGADIRVVAADIGREEDVGRLMQFIGDELPPLKGVVQSAGVLDDGILAQLDWDRFLNLFEPKVYGSWLLHEYTKSLELDFFILKSSLLSLLGSAGQGNYTASSTFLDSLAAYRRAAGLPATTINWCAWSEGGLATVSGARGEAMWSSLGVAYVSPADAMRVFDRLMHRDIEQIAIAAADWPVYADKVGNPPFLTELLQQRSLPDRPQVPTAKTAPDPAPAAAGAEARLAFLEALQKHVMAEMGFEDVIDPDQPLNDLGLDSLMSVSLSISLEKAFGVPVPVAELIKGPTINQLVDNVFCDLIGRFPAGGSGPGRTAADVTQAAVVREPAGPVREEIPPVPAPNGTAAGDADAAASDADERSMLQEVLERSVMAELGIQDALDPDQPLNEYGLDSLMAVSLANSLEDQFGTPVSVADLIKGPSMNQLVAQLFEELSGRLPGYLSAAGAARPATSTRAAAAEAHVQPTLRQPADPRPASAQALETAGGRLEDYSHAGSEPPLLSQDPARGAGGASASGNGHDREAHRGNGINGAIPSARSGNGANADSFAPSLAGPAVQASRDGAGTWLIAPRPNPDAETRLFCFPYAGGGLVSFREWPRHIDDSVEVVAVEPPGRGTRINEAPIDDLETFVERLLPELVEWLDRPSAFFGHCLGGLTMFATLCAVPQAVVPLITHAYACGVRPPHLLGRKGAFEDELLYDMLLHRDFDPRVAPYAQTDEIFADIIRHFDTPAADEMLEIPRLRELLLPTVRAEFKMAFEYEYRPVEPFAFPLSSFVGDVDPWVSAEDSAGWSRFTRDRFTNHVRQGSHFLMEDNRDYILDTIGKEFAQVPCTRL